WSTIIYIAALTGVDPALHEAASIDGANRARQIWHISLPAIKTTMVFVGIMSLAGFLRTGWEQLYLLATPGNRALAETLDLYVVDKGILGGQYGYGAAVGLVQAAIGFTLIRIANYFSKKYAELSLL
ncbi:MAG: ABC transporter permease subunit, partial [Defluviitaleaceae bacterium]|nr:ABC transporter permease subunit [Defluviitaleaceae bacterium]